MSEQSSSPKEENPDSESTETTEENSLPSRLEESCKMTEELPSEEKASADPEPEAASAELSTKDILKQEEAKLKAKFPIAARPLSGQSVFLQKRLANRQKYFDSGDYMMAKQKPSSMPRAIPVPGMDYVTGDAIPTPESVPVRKTSIIQSKFTSSPTSST